MSNGRPQSGDPFSVAYSRQGRRAAKRQAPGQQPGGQGLGQGPQGPGPYEGYGFDMPPGCPPTPGNALETCLRALQVMLGRTFQLNDLAPWIHPPFRATFNCEHVEAVIGPSAALDAAGNAAAVALAAAASGPGFTVPVLVMNAATDFVNLFTLTPQQSNMARIKSWGISPGNAGAKNLETRLLTASVGGTPSPPNPFLSSAEVSEHQDAFLLLQPRQTMAVQARILDVTSPTLVDFGICFWTWPIKRRRDDEQGTLLNPGYGLNCE